MAKEDKEQAILDAATKLFAERGFHGTAVPLIAEAANVGAGTIYRYFKDKEGLVNAIFQLYKEKAIEICSEAVDEGNDPREEFHNFWQLWAVFALSNRDALVFMDFHHHSPYLDERSKEISQRAQFQMISFFERLKSRGAVKDINPMVALPMIKGMFIGMLESIWHHGAQPVDDVISQAEQMCWDSIKR